MATHLKPPSTHVDWVGSLKSTPLAEVFYRIATEERSGDLQINLGGSIKSVYFDHGFVVFSASNMKRDRLGESLIEAGRISRHEFALVSMLMKGSKRKFGQTLVQAGVMSEEELGKQVAAQVNRIVMSTFKVKDAVYSFDERKNVIPVELMVSLSIYRILLEGIRFMTDGKLILGGLPPLNTLVRVAERPPFTIDPKKLKRLERRILKAAGKGVPISTLIRGLDVDRGVALRACYGLFAAGLVEPVEGIGRRQLKVQEETGVFVLSEIEQKFSNTPATNPRQEILMEFDRLERLSDKDLLKLEGPAESTSLRKAFEAQQDEWKKKRALVEAQHTLVTKIDVIQERLQKAYESMREQPKPDTAAPTETPQPGMDRDATTQAESIMFEMAPAQALPPLNDELFEDPGIEFDAGAAVPEEAPDERAEAETEAREQEPAEGHEPALGAGGQLSDVAEEDSARDPGETRASRLTGSARTERVRQLLRDVKLHFQVRDWEHAVSLLFELVELEPDEAKHHGMLARAMARHPVMRKDAERHFIEALRLSPQDADLHYALGLYYKSFGMHARAQIEFRTAIRIRPQHEGARKHLSTGAKGAKDPLRDMFRKIFG